MSENYYTTKKAYYRYGQQVRDVPTGAKQKLPRPQRDHKRFRGGWDLTKLYQDHEK
jgi:hypothetical protein